MANKKFKKKSWYRSSDSEDLYQEYSPEYEERELRLPRSMYDAYSERRECDPYALYGEKNDYLF